MDPVDRLAAYLAGDLDTAEITAVEQEIARDPALRAQVDAMRRADEALGQLSSPALPEGFEDRLHEHLQPVLATQLEGSAAEPGAAGTFDELASRRSERDAGRRVRWAPALGGVAAAALAVLVVVNLGGGAGDNGLMSADMDAADDAETGADDAGDADDGASAEMFADEDADMAAPLPEGPVIVASDREFDQETLGELRYAPEVDDVTAQMLDEARGSTLAGEWQAAFGLEPELSVPESAPDAADEASPEDDDAAVEDRAEVAAAPLLESGRDLDERDRTDIERCLAEIITGPDLIPSYVELGTLDDEQVLVFGLVSIDPATGAFTRPEIWVAERTACEIRYLTQD